MQTPAGLKGQITEEIMAEWRAANPAADSKTYNATYSRVLELVTQELEKKTPMPVRPTPLRFAENAAGVIVHAPSLLEKLAFRP